MCLSLAKTRVEPAETPKTLVQSPFYIPQNYECELQVRHTESLFYTAHNVHFRMHGFTVPQGPHNLYTNIYAVMLMNIYAVMFSLLASDHGIDFGIISCTLCFYVAKKGQQFEGAIEVSGCIRTHKMSR